MLHFIRDPLLISIYDLQEMLNKHPLIRAHKFVGRSQGKDVKDKGLTQAEQKSVRSSVDPDESFLLADLERRR